MSSCALGVASVRELRRLAHDETGRVALEPVLLGVRQWTSMDHGRWGVDEVKPLRWLFALWFVVFFFFMEVADCPIVNGAEIAKARGEVWRDQVWFWAQLASGSSWPQFDSYVNRSCVAFSLAATTGVLLNISALLGVLWILIKVGTARRRSMNIAELIARRDLELKAGIQNIALEDVPESQFGAVADRIDQVFDTANKRLADSLSVVLGPREAELVMGALTKKII